MIFWYLAMNQRHGSGRLLTQFSTLGVCCTSESWSGPTQDFAPLFGPSLLHIFRALGYVLEKRGHDFPSRQQAIESRVLTHLGGNLEGACFYSLRCASDDLCREEVTTGMRG